MYLILIFFFPFSFSMSIPTTEKLRCTTHLLFGTLKTYPAFPIAISGKSTTTTEKIMVETAPILLVSVSLMEVTLH